MTIVLVPVRGQLPRDFDELRADARLEGHTNMERLANDWAGGANRFTAAGEALLAGFIDDALAGVGGMTIDPAAPGALRLRRFYVRPALRRHGVGRRLAEALIARARPIASHLVLNAETRLAATFWEALAFVPEHRDGHSHVRYWPAD